MPIATITDFSLHYDRHFAVVRATTPELLRKVHRLRYQVYCVENPFEDPEKQIDKYEADEYDERSVHTLLLHRRTGEAVGTSRVILPHKGEFRPLPMATMLHGADRCRFDEFPAAQTAEISRFAVSKQFRRRCGEERHADVGFAENASAPEISERRLMPFITLGLCGECSASVWNMRSHISQRSWSCLSFASCGGSVSISRRLAALLRITDYVNLASPG